jgi:AcrR family transcriptional regulator
MTTPTVPTRVSTRDRLTKATEQCLRRAGIRRTTIVDIANEAGVSRGLIYQYFPDKSAIIVATLAEIDESFWRNAQARVWAVDGIAAQVTEAVLLARSHMPGTLALQLKAAEPGAFADTVGVGVRELMPAMSKFWHRYIEAAKKRGEIRPNVDVAHASEWIMRMLYSLITMPGDSVNADDPKSLRRFIDEFLVPGLG